MANKRLAIENLDNLQELNAEEVFSIQGGLSLVGESGEAFSVESEKLIYLDPDLPVPNLPDLPYDPYLLSERPKCDRNPFVEIGQKDEIALRVHPDLLRRSLHWCPVIL